MRRYPRLFVALSLVIAAGRAFAQTGSVSGQVKERSSGVPVIGARVEAQRSSEVSHATATDSAGRYRISDLRPGVYTIVVSRIGQQQRRIDGVVVSSGAASSVDVDVSPIAVRLDQVVTSVSRHEEKVVDAPASAFVISQTAIATTPALTVSDHLKTTPGVDLITGGIIQSNVVTRGFNNAFSTRLLMLQDYRRAEVPSLGVNIASLIPAPPDDIERIEVVLGPGAALYGPGSGDGVLHVITKSPFDSPGGSITLDGGGRSIARGSIRYAAVASPRVAFKLSGEGMTGDDWHYTDPGEPDSVPHAGGFARRDFHVRRFDGEARLDLRPTPGMELTSSYGVSRLGSAIELTSAYGAAQAHDWTYQTVQERFHWNRFFVNAFMNASDAGNRDSTDAGGTFLLRTGQPIVDQSRVVSASAQHSFDAGSRETVIYGGDYIWTNPRTGGTIDGRNEDVDNVTEIGGYVHSVTRFDSKWQLVSALRVDNNNRVAGTVVSPRAALVFTPAPDHNFRFTYNRAYGSPSDFSMFLDLVEARNVGGLPYDVRVLGTPPKEGWSYQRTCAATLVSGLCMRSPFPSALGSPNALVDANAAAYYRAALAAVAPRLPSSVQQLLPILQALNPTAGQVGSVLRFLASPDSVISPAALTDVEPLKHSFSNTFELGYHGTVGARVLLSSNVWYTREDNSTSSAEPLTPNVFLDPQALGNYLGQQIAAALIAQGVPAQQAAATAGAVAPQIAAGLAAVPVGTVAMANGRLASTPDIIYSYRSHSQRLSYGGAELAVDALMTDRWSLAAAYSRVSKGTFSEISTAPGVPSRLNAPQNKGSLGLTYDDQPHGARVEARGRYTDAFAVNSGVYVSGVPNASTGSGTYVYPTVAARTLLDAGLTLRLPSSFGGGNASWSLDATNLLNTYAPTFIGVPSIGRLVMTRLRYAM